MKITLSIITIFCYLFVSSATALSQEYTWRVFLKDKGNETFKSGSELYNKTLALHSTRALERRAKTRETNNLITIDDAPIYKPYINQLLGISGTDLLLQLRWANYLVVRCDSMAAKSIEKLSFVKKIERTGKKLIPQSKLEISAYPYINRTSDFENSSIEANVNNCGVFHYGFSFNQSFMLGVPQLHSLGITGEGSLLAFFDTGFRWRSHNSLKNSLVRGEYDFVMTDSITSNQEGDKDNQDEHGTLVMSTVAGFQHDSLIGVSPFSEFLLAKTEDIRSETRMEEENYAAAVEWAEAQGADIISSSLSYGKLDSTDETYSYDDMNGSFPITSKAVNEAVRRGVVCITAAGNSGPRDSTISSPGDADSVITVAGVAPDGINVVGFSSRGPTASKVPKPDIAAQAIGVVTSSMSDSLAIRTSSGTSFATPLIAGCASLLLSQYPELTSWQVRNSLLDASHREDSVPTKAIGHGVPNVEKAMLKNGPLITRFSSYQVGNYLRVISAVKSNTPVLSVNLIVKFADDDEPTSITMLPTDRKPFYGVDIPLKKFDNKNALAFITAIDGIRERSFPCNYLGNGIFSLLPIDTENIQCGISRDSLPTIATVSTVNDQVSSNNLLIEQDFFDENYTSNQIEISVYDILGNLIVSKEYSIDSSNQFLLDFSSVLSYHGTFYALVKNGVKVKSIVFRY